MFAKILEKSFNFNIKIFIDCSFKIFFKLILKKNYAKKIMQNIKIFNKPYGIILLKEHKHPTKLKNCTYFSLL